MKIRNQILDQEFDGYRVLLVFGEARLLESPEGKLVLIDAGAHEDVEDEEPAPRTMQDVTLSFAM